MLDDERIRIRIQKAQKHTDPDSQHCYIYSINSFVFSCLLLWSPFSTKIFSISSLFSPLCLYVCMSFCPTVFQSFYLSVCCLSVFLLICLFSLLHIASLLCLSLCSFLTCLAIYTFYSFFFLASWSVHFLLACLCLSLSLYFYVCLSVCLLVSFLSDYLFILPSVFLAFCYCIYLPAFLYTSLFVCLSVSLYICQSVSISTSVSVWLSVSLLYLIVFSTLSHCSSFTGIWFSWKLRNLLNLFSKSLSGCLSFCLYFSYLWMRSSRVG